MSKTDKKKYEKISGVSKLNHTFERRKDARCATHQHHQDMEEHPLRSSAAGLRLFTARGVEEGQLQGMNMTSRMEKWRIQ
jgi:hypothetical protein